MNLKDWEKIEEDDDTVTMQHPAGHSMKIAVNNLPKIQREQIRRLQLARGGDVLDSGEEGKSEQGRIIRHANRMKDRGEDHKQEIHFAKEEAKGRAKFSRTLPKPKLRGLAHGGEVPSDDEKEAMEDRRHRKLTLGEKVHGKGKRSAYEEGVGTSPRNGGTTYAAGEVEKSRTAEKPEHREIHKKNARHASKERYGESKKIKPNIKGLAEGGNPAEAPDMPQDSSQAPQPNTPITINVGQPAAQSPIQQVPVSAIAPKPVPINVPDVQVPQPAPVNKASQSGEAVNSLEGVEAAKAGIQGQAQIDAAKAQARIPVDQQAIDTAAVAAQQDANSYKQIAQHTGDFRDYIANHPVNPKHYQESMKTEAKVGTAMALFLGGLGVPFGGHNYAFDHLEKQIDRDIEAQRNNIDNQKTLLGAYQQLYGDNNISTALAKSSLMDIRAKQLDLIADKIGTPQAKVNAQFGIQKLMQDSEQQRINAAGQLALSGMPSGKVMPSGKTGKTPPTTSGSAPSSKTQGPVDYNDKDLKPGSAQAPKTPPPFQVSINYGKFKQSQALGAKGVPGAISPGEVSEANHAIDYANSVNQVIRDIHKQYAEMWKHGSQADMVTTGLEGVSLGPVHIPNIGKFVAPMDMKNYYTAAATIKKQIGNLVKGGLSPEIADSISAQLVQRKDTPDQYRDKLANIENLLTQSIPAGVLKKYGLATNLPE